MREHGVEELVPGLKRSSEQLFLLSYAQVITFKITSRHFNLLTDWQKFSRVKKALQSLKKRCPYITNGFRHTSLKWKKNYMSRAGFWSASPHQSVTTYPASLIRWCRGYHVRLVTGRHGLESCSRHVVFLSSVSETCVKVIGNVIYIFFQCFDRLFALYSNGIDRS